MEKLSQDAINSNDNEVYFNVSYSYYKDIADALNKLKEYEDLEERGLLIKLPCKVGDTVYLLSNPVNVTNFEEEYNEKDILIFECEVQSISKYKDGRNQVRLYWNNKFVGCYLTLEHFGKVIFLTREEAEKASEEENV